jgi:hypothetical protein
MAQDMAKPAELFEQHGVPRFDRNRVVHAAHFGGIEGGRDGRLHIHRSIPFSRVAIAAALPGPREVL